MGRGRVDLALAALRAEMGQQARRIEVSGLLRPEPCPRCGWVAGVHRCEAPAQGACDDAAACLMDGCTHPRHHPAPCPDCRDCDCVAFDCDLGVAEDGDGLTACACGHAVEEHPQRRECAAVMPCAKHARKGE